MVKLWVGWVVFAISNTQYTKLANGLVETPLLQFENVQMQEKPSSDEFRID